MALQLDTQYVEHIALLSFQNPPYNFATVGLLRALADALEDLDSQPRIRAIALSSVGKAFCAGADLASENGFGAESDDPLREFYDQALRIYACNKPIIAAVQGPAIGAGLGLAVAADFRVASPQARFSANFVKLGFHPGFGLTCTLPRIIGHHRAAQMFLTGARYHAEEVAPWGLVDRIANVDSLHDTALNFAREVAENAPLSLLATRKTLRDGLVEQIRTAMAHEHSEQQKLLPTKDFAEGIRAVSERRAGQFSGR